MRWTALRALAIVPAILITSAPLAAQRSDTAYARQIREYTTDTRFLPSSIASFPASARVPSPSEHFGTIIGAPGVMHHASEVYGYFRALAKATPRVKVETVGTTEEGRDIVLAIIADDETMQHLDRYKSLLARLADPRQVPASQVDALVKETKPIYYINAGLHSTEMGSPEMVMELAYRLAVSDEPSIKRIRDHVITIINPVSEPDGRDRQVDWYRHYTKGRPDFDDGFPHSTPYWGDYVLHDNNRDGLQMSQALTKAISKIYYDWHPLVMHDLHESIPLLYVSTGTGPYNEHNDPIAIGEWQTMANNDIRALAAEGLPGVWTWAFFDGWWPGYAVWVANNHNSIGRFFETFGNAGADTYVRDLSRDSYAGDPVTSRQWYRPWPPTKKVRWSSRDNINYQEAGVLSSLTYTVDNATQMLRDFWQKGENSITRGETEKPYAYVIPGFARQRDPKRTAYLVNQLERQHIEIHRRTAGDSAGDFVILRNQPYGELVANLLSEQHYPPTAKYPPYDDIAWTLGLLYGVTVTPVNDSAVFHWPSLELLKDTVAATARVAGRGNVYLLPYRAQDELLPALYWLQGRSGHDVHAWAAETAFTAGRDSFPAGSVIFDGLDASDANTLAQRYALPIVATDRAPSVARHALDLPRTAIYHSWYSTQDEGWARYTFEQYKVPYTAIDKDDLRAGKLRDRFDVIVVPNYGGSISRMIHGVDSKWGPLPYEKTTDTPALGTPVSSPDITGGPGFVGLTELQRFVDDGGTLVTIENATRLVAETGIAGDLSSRSTGSLFHPGSIVRARVRRAASPILYGYPEITTVFRGNAPLFQVPARDSAMVVLQYGTKLPQPKKDDGPYMGMAATSSSPAAAGDSASKMDSTGRAGGSARGSHAARGGADSGYVVSGMVRNENVIVGQGAIFDVPVQQGRVIAFTFDPIHRFLNHHEFPMMWNALLNWNDHPGGAAGAHRAATRR
jgi:hypothetical protein